ncbi:MAG: pyridoxal-phosphate dependent enzyme [Deltaproteobacteria bacterium]|nr:MAG: pyridoxal-phosphate dependent enzyme [Deltaproteobacteria bacterium]
MTLPLMPTFQELLDPSLQPADIRARAKASTDPLDPIHLFRISWTNDEDQFEYRILPPELTGVAAPIVVMCAYRFPTGSHKVGPVYSCVRESLLAGELEDKSAKLVFPSTGNFGIGGAWVGPRMGFRSLVVLPEEMSAERFEKIRNYGAEIIATPGCESNVKEIYDCVNQLKQSPENKIQNQFEKFGNYRFHYQITGGSALRLVEELNQTNVLSGKVAAFVSAMGSAGTIAAGDHLKAANPSCKIVGVEPIQCPTLYNVGYGGHQIEGIGDKHVTWVHNVRNMDLLVCVDDQTCVEGMQLLQEGRDHLAAELGIAEDVLATWDNVFGISSVCNILGAIATARHYEMEEDQIIVTVATDGFDRYPSVVERIHQKEGPLTQKGALKRIDSFRHASGYWVQEGTMETRRRWHNQKYFTWVEQQGKSLEELNALWEPTFWSDQAAMTDEIDSAILKMRS